MCSTSAKSDGGSHDALGGRSEARSESWSHHPMRVAASTDPIVKERTEPGHLAMAGLGESTSAGGSLNRQNDRRTATDRTGVRSAVLRGGSRGRRGGRSRSRRGGRSRGNGRSRSAVNFTTVNHAATDSAARASRGRSAARGDGSAAGRGRSAARGNRSTARRGRSAAAGVNRSALGRAAGGRAADRRTAVVVVVALGLAALVATMAGQRSAANHRQQQRTRTHRHETHELTIHLCSPSRKQNTERQKHWSPGRSHFRTPDQHGPQPHPNVILGDLRNVGSMRMTEYRG
jgi:hypothetical protein